MGRDEWVRSSCWVAVQHLGRSRLYPAHFLTLISVPWHSHCLEPFVRFRALNRILLWSVLILSSNGRHSWTEKEKQLLSMKPLIDKRSGTATDPSPWITAIISLHSCVLHSHLDIISSRFNINRLYRSSTIVTVQLVSQSGKRIHLHCRKDRERQTERRADGEMKSVGRCRLLTHPPDRDYLSPFVCVHVLPYYWRGRA